MKEQEKLIYSPEFKLGILFGLIAGILITSTIAIPLLQTCKP